MVFVKSRCCPCQLYAACGHVPLYLGTYTFLEGEEWEESSLSPIQSTSCFVRTLFHPKGEVAGAPSPSVQRQRQGKQVRPHFRAERRAED